MRGFFARSGQARYDGGKDLACDRDTTCPRLRPGIRSGCRRPKIQINNAYKARTATATAAATPINILLSIKSLFDRRAPAIETSLSPAPAHDPFG